MDAFHMEDVLTGCCALDRAVFLRTERPSEQLAKQARLRERLREGLDDGEPEDGLKRGERFRPPCITSMLESLTPNSCARPISGPRMTALSSRFAHLRAECEARFETEVDVGSADWVGR